MVAQDTGSAIVGPARADIYFGAGLDAGKIAGRLRHGARFVILVPKSLDPPARAHAMPIPIERPARKIARLFPPTAASKDAKDGMPAATVAPAATVQAPVPLPEARPEIKPERRIRRHRFHHFHRWR
jgi:membrane-bound lytic murein transglycosylase A